MSSITSNPLNLALDDKFYSLDEDEATFFRSQTGIQSDGELKEHILAVRKKAFQIHAYSCIYRFSFVRLKISRLPAYKNVLKLGRERQDAILLDIGCCFGNDVRKAVVDGWPIQNVIASDLRQEFWDCGHDLFKSTPESFPAAFIAGDAFDPVMITPRKPFYEESKTPRPTDLRTLSSLTPLQGHVAVIHASALFHLFEKEQQLELAHQLATLLSPVPGSVIFGAHGGAPTPRHDAEAEVKQDTIFHSAETWKDLWDGEVFEKGTVRVEAKVDSIEHPHPWLLTWSVTRTQWDLEE